MENLKVKDPKYWIYMFKLVGIILGIILVGFIMYYLYKFFKNNLLNKSIKLTKKGVKDTSKEIKKITSNKKKKKKKKKEEKSSENFESNLYPLTNDLLNDTTVVKSCICNKDHCYCSGVDSYCTNCPRNMNWNNRYLHYKKLGMEIFIPSPNTYQVGHSYWI